MNRVKFPTNHFLQKCKLLNIGKLVTKLPTAEKKNMYRYIIIIFYAPHNSENHNVSLLM